MAFKLTIQKYMETNRAENQIKVTLKNDDKDKVKEQIPLFSQNDPKERLIQNFHKARQVEFSYMDIINDTMSLQGIIVPLVKCGNFTNDNIKQFITIHLGLNMISLNTAHLVYNKLVMH